MLLLRGLAQPLIERRTLKDQTALLQAIRLADSAEEAAGQDPVLGVSAQAIADR